MPVAPNFCPLYRQPPRMYSGSTTARMMMKIQPPDRCFLPPLPPLPLPAQACGVDREAEKPQVKAAGATTTREPSLGAHFSVTVVV